jgi:CubicO group peptidase (beta-lactamase class C family)
VLPAAWLDTLGDGDPAAFARCTVPEDTSGADGYRNQWWRRDGRVTASGIHGQLIAVDRPTDTVVTVLSSWPDATDRALQAAHRTLVARVCDRLGTAR